MDTLVCSNCSCSARMLPLLLLHDMSPRRIESDKPNVLNLLNCRRKESTAQFRRIDHCKTRSDDRHTRSKYTKPFVQRVAKRSDPSDVHTIRRQVQQPHKIGGKSVETVSLPNNYQSVSSELYKVGRFRK